MHQVFHRSLNIIMANNTDSAIATFSRGAGSLVVDLSMHLDNRIAFVNRCVKAEIPADAFVVAGGGEQAVYDSDTVWDFRQESNFQYLFGVKEPGCFGVINFASGKSILFVPRLPAEYAQWFGPIKPLDWFKNTYLVDSVYYVDEMDIELSNSPRLCYYDFVNLDSGLSVPVPTNRSYVRDSRAAYILNEMRSIKTLAEIEILQYTNDVSCLAHIDTMKEIFSSTRGPVTSMEHFAETNFRFQSGLGGCARVGYHCIACSGLSNAVLHYGHSAEPNNNQVEPSSMRLLDMGAEYHCYTADVTCSFPTSGTFLPEQAAVYESVWAAVLAVESKLKSGVDYRDMQRLAHRTMLKELKERTEMFPGELDELMRHNVCARFFMPHGLGHQLGLAVHDVGGYVPGESKNTVDIGLKGLRLGRVLAEHMVLTVEPGIYFIEYLLSDLELQEDMRSLVNMEAVRKYQQLVGGIRIEDNVVIKDIGCIVLTDVPRTVSDIEKVMQGKMDWVVGRNYRQYIH